MSDDMSIESFLTEWEACRDFLLQTGDPQLYDPDWYDLIRLDWSMVRSIPIHPNDQRFLVEAGLPRHSVASLKFLDLEDGLEEYTESLPKEVHPLLDGRVFYLLGSRGYSGWDGKKIVIEAGTSKVYMADFLGDEPYSVHIRFMNSGLLETVFTILAYYRFFVLAWDDDSICGDMTDWGKYLVFGAPVKFRELVSTFDPAAISDDSDFWPMLLLE